MYLDGWKNLFENHIENGLCVGIFDLENKKELIGVTISKNFNKT